MKKGLRDFFGYAKKSSDLFGETNSEVVIFLGIKYEPLSDLPIIKICEWGPRSKQNQFELVAGKHTCLELVKRAEILKISKFRTTRSTFHMQWKLSIFVL